MARTYWRVGAGHGNSENDSYSATVAKLRGSPRRDAMTTGHRSRYPPDLPNLASPLSNTFIAPVPHILGEKNQGHPSASKFPPNLVLPVKRGSQALHHSRVPVGRRNLQDFMKQRLHFIPALGIHRSASLGRIEVANTKISESSSGGCCPAIYEAQLG